MALLAALSDLLTDTAGTGTGTWTWTWTCVPSHVDRAAAVATLPPQ